MRSVKSEAISVSYSLLPMSAVFLLPLMALPGLGRSWKRCQYVGAPIQQPLSRMDRKSWDVPWVAYSGTFTVSRTKIRSFTGGMGVPGRHQIPSTTCRWKLCLATSTHDENETTTHGALILTKKPYSEEEEVFHVSNKSKHRHRCRLDVDTCPSTFRCLRFSTVCSYTAQTKIPNSLALLELQWWRAVNIGALITTDTILGIPYYSYSIV